MVKNIKDYLLGLYWLYILVMMEFVENISHDGLYI